MRKIVSLAVLNLYQALCTGVLKMRAAAQVNVKKLYFAVTLITDK